MKGKIILWNKELSTNIIWQDFQHKEFLDITNNVFKEFFENKGHVEIQKALEYMDQYSRDHLSIEELYMERFDYPDIEEHYEQHQIFREFVDEMKEVATNRVTEAARLCNKLNLWFVEHIKDIDLKLGDFLRRNDQE